MIKSMTGYGKQVAESARRKYTIEIRTLNSKTQDVNLRVPGSLKDRELDIRTMIGKGLERGKIDILLSYEDKTLAGSLKLNKPVALQYYEVIKQLAEATNEPVPTDVLSIVVKMPDVLVSGDEEVDKQEWSIVSQGFADAIAAVDQFRIQEGALLKREFVDRVTLIKQLLTEVEPFEQERMSRIRERILSSLNNQVSDLQVDMNRLEQELIYYIEKLDITEEKVRLKNNCDYFLETLDEESSSGKKLGFISQEIGREINTLGSKANDSQLQRIVVLMKDELEKIKEQLFNIL
ncbi:MAG: YicC/YloC family endoribonuclease [Bacteroidales bacterium]|nr:YicC/YloC family endoribonuclease [Bacteroidales bacterium]